jgi:hypothetical protein
MGKLASGMRLNVGRPMVAARSPGGRRSITGVELLQGLMEVNMGRLLRTKRKGKPASEMRTVTWNVCTCSKGSVEVGGGRNSRRSAAVFAGNRRPCARLRASRSNSLYPDEEDDEAHPPVPSERRGMVCSGGAMAR